MTIRTQRFRSRVVDTWRRAASRLSRRTDVDTYWTRHTVNSKPFATAAESSAYLDWRFAEYPLFGEFMQLYEGYDGKAILDYGCGPGDDVIGFLTRSQVAHVTGVDV